MILPLFPFASRDNTLHSKDFKFFILSLLTLLISSASTSFHSRRSSSLSKFVRSFILIEFSQYDDLIDCFGELPTSKYQEMGADGSCCMAITLCWGISDVLAILPAHFFGTPNLEILALLFFQNVPVTIS